MIVWLIVGIVGAAIGSIGVASIIHHKRVDKFFEQSLKVGKQAKNRAVKHTEEGAGVSITVFDALYDSYRLSPETLAGIEHLHHGQEFNNFKELSEFVNNLGGSFKSQVDKYKGYTGEELVFEKLRDFGHEVEIPESGTHEGYDATVGIDDQKIDVAITKNASYVKDKLNNNDPDTLVYTNKEMAYRFGDHPDVIVDPQISEANAFSLTESTFEAINDPSSYSDKIPGVTLCIAAFRHGNRYRKGEVEGKTAAKHATSDGVIIGGGLLAGGKIGAGIGAAIAPATAGISIPICTIAGSIVGGITGRLGSEYYKSRPLKKAIETLNESAENLYKKFKERFSVLMLKLDLNFSQDLVVLESVPKKKESYLKRLLFPSVFSKFCSKSKAVLIHERKSVKKYYEELSDKLRSMKAGDAGMTIYWQGTYILLDDHTLKEQYDDVDQKFKSVDEEKQKLGKKTKNSDEKNRK